MSWKAELAAEIVLELADKAFARYTHGRKHTNDHGCKGPLCMKASRDSARDRNRVRNFRTGKPVQRPRYVPTWKDIYLTEKQQEYELALAKKKARRERRRQEK